MTSISSIQQHLENSTGDKDRWSKKDVEMMLQHAIDTMPINSPREMTLRLNYIKEYNRMRGFIETEPRSETTNNLLVITSEENKKLWREKLEQQQKSLNL